MNQTKYLLLRLLLIACLLLAACSAGSQSPAPSPSPTASLSSPTAPSPTATSKVEEDTQNPVDARVEALLSQMTLAEKIGQMTQVENNSITPDEVTTYAIGSDAHRQLARETVQRSLVLLKNDGGVLPLAKDAPLILVAGQAADDIGIQAGGWTIEWQGKAGNITEGTTILDGMKQAVSADTKVVFNRFAKFDRIKEKADVGIAVVGELPYAEGLFVGLAFWSLVLIRRGRLGWAALLAVLAAFTRSVGVALAVPLLIAWLEAFRSLFGGNSQAAAYYLIEWGSIVLGFTACIVWMRRQADVAWFGPPAE